MSSYMKTCLLFFIFTTSNLISQNLVPNSGFELFHKLPVKKANSINRSKDWIPPKYSSDYYHAKATRSVGTPKNIFGKQKPHSGNAYAGICTRTKFLEYLEAKLIEPLKKGQEYLIELYISKAERSIGSIREFGVLFTNKKIWGITTRGISSKPQIIFYNPKGYKNKKEWIKLSAKYTATGQEAVMTFGHFNYNPSDDKRRIICHYYVDDISITPITQEIDSVISSPTMLNENKNGDTIVESIFSPNIDETITLTNIFFDPNKSELLSKSYTELDKLVQYLKTDNANAITISGHTDNTGNENQNKNLSELRAKAVADYLILQKIDKARIKYIGYGSTKPITTNNTDAARQLNRRVEYIISKK